MSKRKIKSLLSSLIILIIIGIISIFGSNLENNYHPKKEQTKETVSIEGDNLKIYFLDVGQADSILINDSGKYMLIDAGNNEDGDKLVNYFKDLNIESFDYIIGTHPHEDHIGGMDNIIKNFDVKNYYMPDVITTTKTFEEVLDSLDEKNIKFNVPKDDEEISLTNAKIKFLYSGTDTSDLNNTSIVLKINYGNNNFLMMGDATSTTEKKILEKDLQSDLLKVGHHGSKYSTTDNFLNKVNPKYAIISVGNPNSYDHPKDETLKRLTQRDIKIFRTDQDGSIIATSDGNKIDFETIKTDLDGK